MRWFASRAWMWGVLLFTPFSAQTTEIDVYIPDMPDYLWFAGCTGTGFGMIAGYWDRHGFPNMYTGPTGGGVAPLDNFGDKKGIIALWANRAGLDGRATNNPGHIDDYWTYYSPNNEAPFTYESTDPDPYKSASGREHLPDCIGDFIGLSQNKWTNMNNECDGNIDSYAFVFWDNSGNKRVNFVPPNQGGMPVPDVPSGMRTWTKWRGYRAEVFSQLVNFNTNVPAGRGFTFEDVKAEINAGYPIFFYQQKYNQSSRSLTNETVMRRANPEIHAGVIFGYGIYDGNPDGTNVVWFRSTWANGDNYAYWKAYNWPNTTALPVRGVCGYHPLPRITSVARENGQVTLSWQGPAGQLVCSTNYVETVRDIHFYVVERSVTLNPADWVAITSPSLEHAATVPEETGKPAFYRVKLVKP